MIYRKGFPIHQSVRRSVDLVLERPALVFTVLYRSVNETGVSRLVGSCQDQRGVRSSILFLCQTQIPSL